MSLPRTSPDDLMLDVRERLVRIETKLDGTTEKLKDHDRRITENTQDIETLRSAVASDRTRRSTIMKMVAGGAAVLTALGGVAAWFFEHIPFILG